jgi:DNA-directed RNA polymerase subunit L
MPCELLRTAEAKNLLMHIIASNADEMELKIIEDEPKSMILEFKDADRGIAELIKDRLTANKDVDFAGVIKEHPEIGMPRLVVKASRARSLVIKAVEEVQEEIKEMASQLPKAK